MGCTGFYLVLPCFPEMLPSFTGFDIVVLGFTGFYLVFMGCTGFYLVFMGFTEFPGFNE